MKKKILFINIKKMNGRTNRVLYTPNGMKRQKKGSVQVLFNNRTGCRTVCKKKNKKNMKK